MDRIQTETVHMVMGHPIEGILKDEMSDRVTLWPVIIDGFSPWGPVSIREVRSKLAQVIALRTQMVVHNVQNHSEADRMTRIHQPLEAFWPAVAILCCVEICA